MLQVYPALRPCALEEVYADILEPNDAPRVMLNAITTVDGRAAIEGGSFDIGGPTDHALMRRIRALADAVLVGAGTLRREGVAPGVPPELEAERVRRGMRPQPLWVVLGGTGGAPLRGRLATLGPERLVVCLPEGADPSDLEGLAMVRLFPGARPDPRDVVRYLLKEHAACRLLLEGGPSVNGSFARAGLLDEVFWTVAPKLAGGGDAPAMFEGAPLEGGAARLSLLSVYAEGDELYLRYRVERGVRDGVV
jgi:riboflavin biosynthesis pyrimidine reductase